ncbi:thyrotropin-releasing hormone receptor-like [Mercenaria mercenaria]|uniref:thyrotropin-releasing hormone receptor-like n=1 Tax=Mercenaria mercenaria TaxID=6596 RepID=UPI001E1D756F|nr:thyrotropin-releasing hormone receptor-like [Mercenaria mercenaria]
MSTFEYSHFRSEAELRAGVLIWQIVSPVLIIFGTVGNVLSIIVLSKRKFNRWASTVYLLGLAVADLFALYVGLMRQWIKYLFDSDIRAVHPVLCKVHWWLMYTCADVPVWILTAITIERLISTLCPYKSKTICTKHRAKVILALIVVGALSINSHLLYGFGKLEISGPNVTIIIPCAPMTDEYDHFFGKVWTWIDLCKYSLLPFALLSTGNICIIYKLASSSRKVRTQVAPSTSQTQAPSGNERTSNMSVLLVCLNFVFITCTAPVCIYFIGEPYWIPKDVPRTIQLQDPWWAIVNMLMYINNSANFVLYCLTGSRFRESVRKLFRCHDKTSRGIPTVAGNTTINTRSVVL